MAGEDLPIVFVAVPNTHLRCPLCQMIYRDPVIAVSCGHTFCRACVTSSKKRACPIDGVEVLETSHVFNRIVSSQIDDLLIYCRYGLILDGSGSWQVDPGGCKGKITLGKRDEHESKCTFGTVPCPNSAEDCGKFRVAELNQHLAVCPHTPCHNTDKGCDFFGTKDDVLEHLRGCGYRGLQRPSSHSTNEHLISDLKNEVNELRDEMERVKLENRAVMSEVNRNSSMNQMLQKKVDSLQSVVEGLQRSVTRPVSVSPVGADKPRPVSREVRSSSVSSLSGSSKRKYETWEMPFTFKCIGTFRGHKNTVFCTATHRRRLYSSGADGELKIWDLERLSLGCVKTLQGHTKTVLVLIVGHGCVYSAGEDFSIRMWGVDTGEEHCSLENAHENSICAMALSDQYLFTSSHSLIKVWDARSLSHIHSMSGLCHWVRALALQSTQEFLYSGSHNTIDVWDATGKFTREGKIDHEFGSVYSLAITKDYLIAGTYNRNIQVFELVSGSHVVSLRGHIGAVTSLQVAPSGCYLFSGSADKSIKIFDIKSHAHVRGLMGHISTVSALLVPPSGRFLFSASHDKSVQVWNLENMLPIQSLMRHEGAVNCLSLQGDYLISGSEDTEIKIYKYFRLQMGVGL